MVEYNIKMKNKDRTTFLRLIINKTNHRKVTLHKKPNQQKDRACRVLGGV